MKLKNLDSFMEHLTGERGYPGNSVKIYHNHSQVYEYATGYADREEKTPFSTSTFVNLYSTTKVITCACAMTLFEKGKFLMTDPLYYYIPEFKDIMVRDKDSNGNVILRPAKRPITIRDLFTMTAGFTYDLWTQPIRGLVESNPNAPLREFIAKFVETPLSFMPGQQFQYSLCHDVLAAVVEVVSGKKFSN
jgi:CubicO group peptidase (beta-lactamase class C family)